MLLLVLCSVHHRAGRAPDRAGDGALRAGDRDPRTGAGACAGAPTAALAFEKSLPNTRLPPVTEAAASAWATSGTNRLR